MGNFQEVEGGTPIPFFLFRLGQTGTDHLAYLDSFKIFTMFFIGSPPLSLLSHSNKGEHVICIINIILLMDCPINEDRGMHM